MKLCLESNNNLIKNQSPYNQTENDEIPGTEYDSKDRGTSKTSQLLNFSNSQLDVTNFSRWWKHKYVKFKAKESFQCDISKYYVKHGGHNNETVRMFPSGSEDMSKSHLVKAMNNVISKNNFKDPDPH